MSAIELDYWALEELCRKEGAVILYSSYLGKGAMGRFFPPNIILIDDDLCDADTSQEQNKVIVLLHQMSHYFSWLNRRYKKPPKDEEERAFEFAEVMCSEVLNRGASIENFNHTIERLGLSRQADLLQRAIKEVVKQKEN